ncbi:MAG TPA: HdeD family acid-resistance protein [Candidatus Binataceae bacterium]|nr:HdeD family acid-resistance protein [Candidatus Binataceae bacterium]
MMEGMLSSGIEEVRNHRAWFFIWGVLLIVLGCIAVGSSVLATLVSVMLLGWILIFGGVFAVIHGLMRRQWHGHLLNLLAGVLYAVTGLLMVTHTTMAALTLTLLIAMLLIVAGTFRLFVAFSLHLHHRGWVALSGIVAIVLGLMILDAWPVSGLWVIGLFIGIDLIFDGWTEVMLAMVAGRIAPA